MKAIEITEKDLISEGNHRKIYAHPIDLDKCIKIPKVRLKNRSRDREIKYLLKYSKLSSDYLSMYLGDVATNLGTGYIFHLIRDANGAISSPLSKLRRLEGLEEKIYELYSKCLRDGVVIGDLHPGNVVAQMFEDSSYKLWVIDGAGNSDYVVSDESS